MSSFQLSTNYIIFNSEDTILLRRLLPWQKNVNISVVVVVGAAVVAAVSSDCIMAAVGPLFRFGHQIDLGDKLDKQRIPSSFV